MLEQLKELILQFVEADPTSITPESRFVEDLGFNSYDFISLVGQIEDFFGVEVQERDVVKIRSVGEAMDYIASLQK